VTEARFAVLTDGCEYRFYTDLDEPNRMDSEPFFVFDMEEINERTVEQLKKFMKSSFDTENILAAATELKYKNVVRDFLGQQLTQPSEAFIRLAVEGGYKGRFTQTVFEQFAPIVKDSMRLFISEQVEKRLKSALASEQSDAAQAGEQSDQQESGEDDSKGGRTIETTQDEMDGYFIVKSIVREVIDAHRVTMRDTQSYCGVLIDDNSRKGICRLRFNTSQKYISILDKDKNEEKFPIETVDEIYNFADKLKKAAELYV
jgi:hypothetical protein